jgi:mannosylglycerate synthase
MSVVCFPFKVEDPAVVLDNVEIAAAHPRVRLVLCVAAAEDATYGAVTARTGEIGAANGTPVEVIVQDRIGGLRPGKGDGMNTALRWFLTETDESRLHFYDSDITSFGPDWITAAEDAGDFGYGVVRHYFPRASTDAMITWMITRTGFALLWPRSELPWIEQPLGGELMFDRAVVERLVADDRVQNQSDWGIDTMYTFATTQAGIPFYEAYMAGGKVHSLYGRLTDLRSMLVECFQAIRLLRGETMPEYTAHRIEYPGVAPPAIVEKLGYGIEATVQLLTEQWTDRQAELARHFPVPIRDGLLANRQRATYDFMDEEAWYDAYLVMLEHAEPGDEDWADVLFRLWTARVLQYTTSVAIRGYDYATRYLHSTVTQYMRRSALGRS